MGRWHMLAISAVAVILTATVTAHDAHVVGPYRIEIGWGDEPAFTGVRNSVVVEITDARTRAPVDDLAGGSLSVEIVFGNERMVLPLQPAGGRGHELRALIVPTRAGTYTFHLTGTVRSQAIDLTSTCSEKTFDCVVSASAIQFPAKDPSPGELGDRVERAMPRADRAIESAARAEKIALSAVGVSAAAAVIAVGFGLRRKRGG
jgi:hypothetical protein